jgi:N-acetylglucosaminyldiphosphoundecaprenol N-acetyl-beta-D-mannosaminyltransferase
MLNVCDDGRALGHRHFFYGGGEGIAERLGDVLTRQFPGLNVVGTYCPPFRDLTPEEDNEIVSKINATKPDIVWVGLGAPKQEKWMASHLGRIHAPAMIGVGAAFDFHTGNVPWAPRWMRRSGLEWAYRLFAEPRRMWRRNLDSPLFLGRILTQSIAKKLKRLTGGRRNPRHMAEGLLRNRDLGLNEAEIHELASRERVISKWSQPVSVPD